MEWRLDQTFSNATDPRRQRGETLEEALRPARLEAGEEEGAGEAEVEGEDGDLVHHSITALALGCLLGRSTSRFCSYWKRVQNGLVDLVRQVGFPKFFWTLAPSECTTSSSRMAWPRRCATPAPAASPRLPAAGVPRWGQKKGDSGIPRLVHLLVFGDDDLVRTLDMPALPALRCLRTMRT